MSVPEKVTPNSPWPSSHSGWYSRNRDITPYEGPPIPISAITEATVKVAMFLNAQTVANGFNAAILAVDPEILGGRKSGSGSTRTCKFVLDAAGQLHQFLDKNDSYDYITKTLASQALRLPSTGSFRNTWGIHHEVTCRPIDILYLPQGSEPKFHQVAVYGYIMPYTDEPDMQPSRGPLPLSKEVGDYTTLPPELDELFGLVLEACSRPSAEVKNKDLIEAIREVVKNGNP